MVRLRSSPARKALTEAQRGLLLDLCNRVSPTAREDDPDVATLCDFIESLAVPWWMPSGRVLLSLGAVERGLAEARRLAICTDYGEQPRANRPFRLPAYGNQPTTLKEVSHR